MKLFEGDKIKFKYYANIDPYPVCIGIVQRVYGVSYFGSAVNKDNLYSIDVNITEVLNDHYAKYLVGQKVRIMSNFDIEKI